MKKKTSVWMKIIGAIFILSGIAELRTNFEGSVMAIVIGVALFTISIIGRKRAKQNATQTAAVKTLPTSQPQACTQEQPQPVETWPKTTMVFYLGVPIKIGEYRLKYSYKDVKATIDDLSLEPGAKLDISADGELSIAGRIVGHTYSHLDMIVDWQRRQEPYTVRLFALDRDGSALLYMAFYREPNFENERICKLIGGKSAAAQTELMTLNGGEEVDIEEDDESGRYDVTYGERIGYLSKPDADWYAALDVDHIAEVYDVKENDAGKYTASIIIKY